MLMNVIIENNDNEAPSTEDLAGWADNFGLTLPVVADPGAAQFWQYSASGALPTIVLIDHGVLLTSVDEGAHEAEVEALLEQYQ